MKKVILTKGLPASGKTTWAKSMVKKNTGSYKRINKDDLREMLDCSHWSKGNEKFVLHMRDGMILAALADGKHVIVDDTNFNSIHERNIRELVHGLAKVEIKEFEVDLDECIRRDAAREKPVGEKVIRDMYNKYVRIEIPPVKYIAGAKNAIIVDVDGTLAKMRDRGPYDWNKVGNDDLYADIAEIVDFYKNNEYAIIIVTGRDGICEEETREWLEKNLVPYDEFYIRPAGNTEKDSIIKKRIYDEHIKGKYNIHIVLDDRDQVVKMWRSIGLRCLQVADGNF